MSGQVGGQDLDHGIAGQLEPRRKQSGAVGSTGTIEPNKTCIRNKELRVNRYSTMEPNNTCNQKSEAEGQQEQWKLITFVIRNQKLRVNWYYGA